MLLSYYSHPSFPQWSNFLAKVSGFDQSNESKYIASYTMFGQNRSQSLTDYRSEIPNKKTIQGPSFRSNFKTKAIHFLKSISTLPKNRSFPLPFRHQELPERQSRRIKGQRERTTGGLRGCRRRWQRRRSSARP